MTAALLRWWAVPKVSIVILTNPVLVRAVLQKTSSAKDKESRGAQ